MLPHLNAIKYSRLENFNFKSWLSKSLNRLKHSYYCINGLAVAVLEPGQALLCHFFCNSKPPCETKSVVSQQVAVFYSKLVWKKISERFMIIKPPRVPMALGWFLSVRRRHGSAWRNERSGSASVFCIIYEFRQKPIRGLMRATR